MRVIDYYIGIPLCMLASVWLRLLKFFSFARIEAGPPKKVVFLELSEMGSAILVDSALRWTKAQGAEIYFVIFKRNVGSLRLLGTVPEKNLFLIRENNLMLFAWDSLQYLLWCRRHDIDAIVDLELFSRYTSLLTAFSGARERIGFHAFHNEGLYRGEVLTRKVAYNPHLHIAKNFMALVKSLFEKTADIPFYKGEILDSEIVAAQAQVTEASKARVLAAMGKYVERPEQVKWILLNCAGGEFLPQRRWPVAHYAKLAQMILDRHPGTKILLTGSPQEREEVDPIRVKASREDVINFAGDILFEDLTALYTLSHVMITNDSGPAHFASTTKMQTFVFFGPETPKLYGALGNFTPISANFACSPCVTAFNHRKTPCEDNRCLQVITPEQVYEMILPCLA
ncbi:MAG: glycosyltransferase family 9 protein [Bdellovibrio sp.]